MKLLMFNTNVWSLGLTAFPQMRVLRTDLCCCLRRCVLNMRTEYIGLF